MHRLMQRLMRLMRLCMLSAWSLPGLRHLSQHFFSLLQLDLILPGGNARPKGSGLRFQKVIFLHFHVISCIIMYYHGISYLILIHWIEPFPHLQSLNFVLVAPSSTWQAWLVSLKVRGHLRPGFACCNAKKHHTSNIQVGNTKVPSRPTQTVSNHPENKIKSSNQKPTRVKLFSPS